MSFNVAETRHSFPFAYDRVYDGLLLVLSPAGFKVKLEDRGTGRVTASAGVSAFSWGENLVLQVQRRDDGTTDLFVQSKLWLILNVTAITKNRKNGERVIGALSNFLQDANSNVADSIAAAPSNRAPKIYWVVAVVAAGVLSILLLWSANALNSRG